MKCPVCGAVELIHDTRDLPYTYKGETNNIPDVTADFCPACDESITDLAETERVMREMGAFNNRVNAAIVNPNSENLAATQPATDLKGMFGQAKRTVSIEEMNPAIPIQRFSDP